MPPASTESTPAEARLRAAYDAAMSRAGLDHTTIAAVHDHVDSLLYAACPNGRTFQLDDQGSIAGEVAIDLHAVIDNDLEGVLDLLSEALTGCLLLQDVGRQVLGHDGDTLRLLVSGDPSEVIAQHAEEERPDGPDESRLSSTLRTQAGVVRRLLHQFGGLDDVQGEEAADLVRRALANLRDLDARYHTSRTSRTSRSR